MIEAMWGTDYDWREDKCYTSPMCPKCDAPIVKAGKKYVCISCGKEEKISITMKRWIDKRSGNKTKTEKCFKCGQKTMITNYYKNAYTCKWEAGHGECTSCGIKFIV